MARSLCGRCKTGRCADCDKLRSHKNLSARQQAKLLGHATYQAIEICFDCGEYTQRPTATGICPCGGRRPTRIDEFPPAVNLPRDEAAALGFDLYTVEPFPCFRKHPPLFWTKSGLCVRCLLGD